MDERTRKILEQEKDTRVLRALIESMAEHIELQRKIIDRVEAEKNEKEQAAFSLEERVKLLRRSLFGKSSEKRHEASDRPRDKSQEEALLFSQSAFPSPESRDDKNKGKARGSEQIGRASCRGR